MNFILTHLQQAFAWTWQTSLSAALLAALVLVAQKALGRWLTPLMRYSLSLLVLIRVLLPVAPSSALSLENLFRHGRQPIKTLSPQVNQDSMDETAGNGPTRLIKPVPPPRTTLRDWLSATWASGCLVLLFLAVRRYRQWKRLIEQGRPVPDARLLASFDSARQEMGVRRAVELISVVGLSSPAVFGFRRVRLLLPEDAVERLSVEDWRVIFLHELAHVRRNDTGLNMLLIAVQFLHWFNPLIWLANHRLRADRELVCDAMALRHVPANERHAYGQVLLRLMDEFSTETPVFAGAVPVVGSKEEMKRRLMMIKQHERGGIGAGLATALAVAALTCASFTRAEEQTPTAVALQTGAHIAFDALEHDFGTVQPGGAVQHTFFVTNTGDAVLEITNIHPACGCTTVGHYPRTIAPGASAAIPVQLNVSKSATSIHKTLSVYSNAKDQAKVVLVLKGTASKPAGAAVQTPVKLDMSQVSEDLANMEGRMKEANVAIQGQVEVIKRLAARSESIAKQCNEMLKQYKLDAEQTQTEATTKNLAELRAAVEQQKKAQAEFDKITKERGTNSAK